MRKTRSLLLDLSRIEDGFIIAKSLVDFLRPSEANNTAVVENKVENLCRTFEDMPEEAQVVRLRLSKFITSLRFLPLYSDVGILQRRGFLSELGRRINRYILPAPSVVFSARNLVEQLFDDRDDVYWVKGLSTECWLKFFAAVCDTSEIRFHLWSEALYSLEMLSIWFAAEEMQDELLRLDPAIAAHDSNLIAQEREISAFIAAKRAAWLAEGSETNNSKEGSPPDISPDHAWVLLGQCQEMLARFNKLAPQKGSSLRLTYILERNEQILARICDLLTILSSTDPEKTSATSIALFKRLIRAQSKDRRVSQLFLQTYHLLSRSVLNNASRAGEHYITRNRSEHFEMLKRGLGGGVIIATMALIKIYISGLPLTPGVMTFWFCINYATGFMLIHVLHFTIATKQPTMTAAYIAQTVGPGDKTFAERQDAANLLIQAARSLNVAIFGNVAAALPVALIIGLTADRVFNQPLFGSEKAGYLLNELNPFSHLAFFYAAITGLWLFLSGALAGYFDNLCAYLSLAERIRLLPWLRKIAPEKTIQAYADYIGDHFGALMGNIFFGIMLGTSGYIGYLTGLPIDSLHVAFSVANVGYSATVANPGIAVILQYLIFALLIGVINSAVSFLLAISTALRANGTSLGDLRLLLTACYRQIRNDPSQMLLPPKESADI